MTRLRDQPDDLFALCGAAAAALGIPDPSFVEKDFWVVELLRSVVRPLELEPVGAGSCSAVVMFKGGTSLSKAYGLLNRFSEDVDVLVAITGYGANARDTRVLKPICVRAQDDLGLQDASVKWLPHSTGTTRNVDYMIPQRYASSAIRSGVRLEMGIRGGVFPGTLNCQLRSYIAQYLDGGDAEFDELAPVGVDAIAPVRTLAEKLALLHHAGCRAQDGDPTPLKAAGRHFYDIDRLLGDSHVREQLSLPKSGMRLLAEDVDKHSEEFGWSFSPRPDAGYAVSPAFDLNGPVRQLAEAAYLDGLALTWGPRREFNEIVARVKDLSDLL